MYIFRIGKEAIEMRSIFFRRFPASRIENAANDTRRKPKSKKFIR
jgi:hypothetical protein